MSDNKKYYYLKLKEDFFDNEEMKVLESMKNGVEYQNVYLKMCLLSLKSDGALMFKNMLPYSIEMLSSVLRVNIDTIKTAIEIFQKIGLISITDTETIYMTDIQTLVGQSSTEAERVKKYRQSIAKKQQESIAEDKTNQGCTESVQMYTNRTEMLQNCTPEIRDKSIEFKDKNLDTNSTDAEFSEKTKSKKSSSSKTEEKAETGKQVKAVLNAYIQNFKELYKQGKVNLETPIIDYKVATVLIKKLLNTISVEQIIQILADAMNDSWIVGEGYCLNFMLSATQANKLLSRKPVIKSGQSPYRQVYTDEEYRAWSDDPDTTPF